MSLYGKQLRSAKLNYMDAGLPDNFLSPHLTCTIPPKYILLA